MSGEIISSEPLPLNFPQDFLSDRSLLSRLLAFAAKNGAGNKQEISGATGIPTGKSTGKVEPMIRYASGMGLVNADRSQGNWKLRLSEAGRLVLDEDPYLEELPTQWFCHLMLCRRDGLEKPAKGVADTWFTLFAEGGSRLGNPFGRAAFHDALVERHGQKSYFRSLSGLVPRTYLEPSCLGGLGILQRADEGKNERYRRLSAPNNRALYPAYSSFLFLVWDALFPDRQQVPLEDLFTTPRLLAILSWTRTDAQPWIHWMCERNLLRLDNLTGITMALRLTHSPEVIKRLYDELV